MSKRVTLGACALGMALLAGCTIYVEDPDPPPPQSPPDSDPPPESDPPPPPPPESDPPPPPPPLGFNVSGDEYDAANHRLLISDCPNNALLALDLATGERSVLIDAWPWTEPGNEPCVGGLVVAQDGRRAFATMRRTIPDPAGEEGDTCESKDLVAIDLETREVTQLDNIQHECGQYYYRGYSSLQIDEYQGRLLYLDSDSAGDDPTMVHLSSTPLPGGGSGPSLERNLSGDCHPQREGCAGETWKDVAALAFDPGVPEQRVVMLARNQIIGESSYQYSIDTHDLATGATIASQPLALTPGALAGVSIDAEKQRFLLTRDVPGQWSVVAVDLTTGQEAVLYDGSPTADGRQLACSPTTAFDSRERRLLLIEPIGGRDDCKNGVFAVDADTGAFTQIAERIE
jgi:hypothetical protein